MLTFRRINYENDLNQIIPLIQANLDADYSLDFFKWKHLENPFGRSFGLLALDGNKIVGLRMFMFWEFSNNPEYEVIRAIRPVDTVTDKGYRGRGLFKKLTLDGLKKCENEYDLVFNTPNENSLPGYLKMGWQRILNTGHIKLGVINLFSGKLEYKDEKISSFEFKPAIDNFQFQTNRSLSFIRWRYRDSSYKLASFLTEETNFIIYKKEKIKGISTIIIYEIYGNSGQFSKMVNSLARKLNCLFVYFLDNQEFEKVNFVTKFKRKEPVVVFKNDKFSIQHKLTLSLGDLEGKL